MARASRARRRAGRWLAAPPPAGLGLVAAAAVMMSCRGEPSRPADGRTPAGAVSSGAAAAPAGAVSSGTAAAPEPTDAARLPVVLGRLRLTDETPPGARPWAPEPGALERQLQEAVTAAGVVGGAPPDPAFALTVRARVIYGLASGGAAPAAGPGAARWQIEASLRAPGEPVPLELVFDVRDEAAFDGRADGLPAFLQARLRAALASFTAELRARLDIVARPLGGLIAALELPVPAQRRLAVERLGMMRAAAAVPALAARLKSEPDRDTMLRLVGALAEIGDARAAAALIARADPKDRELLRAVVDALAELEPPSPAVTDFYQLLSLHDAPDVREMVSQARERLEARRRP